MDGKFIHYEIKRTAEGFDLVPTEFAGLPPGEEPKLSHHGDFADALQAGLTYAELHGLAWRFSRAVSVQGVTDDGWIVRAAS